MSVITSTLVSILAITGVAYAASIDATSKLGGNSGDDFEFNGTGRFNSVVIGKQAVGGVTFFNGTIVNSTTTDGNDNPVTFGDNVRIDGRVYRGATAGSADSQPFIVNDNLETEGSISANGNITQDSESEGVAKAWAHVSSDGSLIRGYNIESATKQATGTYNVEVPFDPAERVFSVTPSGSSDDTVAVRFAGVVNSATDNTVRVRTYQEDGTLADSVFLCL